MKPNTYIAIISIFIGVIVTGFGFLLSIFAAGSNLKNILYWQGFLLQNLIPAPNIGTSSHPIYEATPLHIVAYFLGIPLGFVVYSLLAFVLLSLTRRKIAA